MKNLLSVRQNIISLKDQIIELNDDMQKSGSKLVAKVFEILLIIRIFPDERYVIEKRIVRN